MESPYTGKATNLRKMCGAGISQTWQVKLHISNSYLQVMVCKVWLLPNQGKTDNRSPSIADIQHYKFITWRQTEPTQSGWRRETSVHNLLTQKQGCVSTEMPSDRQHYKLR